jgi:hypothetical protein
MPAEAIIEEDDENTDQGDASQSSEYDGINWNC